MIGTVQDVYGSALQWICGNGKATSLSLHELWFAASLTALRQVLVYKELDSTSFSEVVQFLITFSLYCTQGFTHHSLLPHSNFYATEKGNNTPWF